MLPKPGTRMARLQRTTQLGIWVHSFLALLPEQFLPMEAAIGGHLTVTEATITRTRRRTVALTMDTVITTARLITTITPAPMAGMAALMAPMDLRIGELVIILIRVPTLEAERCRLLMEPEALRKLIIHTPAPMRRRDKIQVPQPNGVVRMCREETRALPRAITLRPMAL